MLKNLMAAWAVTCCCFAAQAMIAGIVADESGNPIANVRVFAEPGVEGALVEGIVGADGAFEIPGAFYGGVGVFAFAPGHGYGGQHLNIAVGDEPHDLVITLTPETTIEARVADSRGGALSGARVTSLALTRPRKVGVPLSKLSAFGVALPTSDVSGRITVSGIPTGAVMALKFEHPLYAQEALTDVVAGASDIRVTMHRGVTVRGQVVIRGTDAPVSSAVVTGRNAQPPHDTTLCVSDGAGFFTMRLKPGVYLFQAYGAGRVSPGLQRLEVTGETPEQTLRLALSETGVVAGTMRDARTGEPIPGARVLLETMGHAAGAARTGRDGRFRLNAAAGVNTLHFESVEGYLPPDTRALRVTVPANDALELPGMWLAPVPVYSVRVVEDDGETPVPGAFISLLRPRQLGWQRADAQGHAVLRFTALPDDNRIIGFAEHPGKDHGALFAVDRQRAEDAVVALLPLARVTGRVVNTNGAPIAGASVGALYADDALPEALPLWRVLTGRDGSFSWHAAPAGVPQRCMATRGSAETVARDINPAPAEYIELGNIALAASESALIPDWGEQVWLCGPQPDLADRAGFVVIHCRADEAPVYISAVSAMREQLRQFNIATLVAVIGEFSCDETPVPVYRSSSAIPATALYGHDGVLRMALTGLPPIGAIRSLTME